MKYGILLVHAGVPAENSPEALRLYAETVLGTKLFTDGLGLMNSTLFKAITIPAKAKAWQTYFFSEEHNMCANYCITAQSLEKKLSACIATSSQDNCIVVTGFRCGNPSLAKAVVQLKETGCDTVLIAPMYALYFKPLVDPALYEARSVIQQAMDAKWSPRIKELHSLCDTPGFAKLLARRIMQGWEPGNVSRVLLLMPSQPRSLFDADATFGKQVNQLKEQLEKRLRLGFERLQVSYVSDFDNGKWVGPFAEKTLLGWAGGAVKDIRAVSPVFCAADPLGSFDAGFQLREFYLSNSYGKKPEYQFVPSFGDDDDFVKVLSTAIVKRL